METQFVWKRCIVGKPKNHKPPQNTDSHPCTRPGWSRERELKCFCFPKMTRLNKLLSSTNPSMSSGCRNISRHHQYFQNLNWKRTQVSKSQISKDYQMWTSFKLPNSTCSKTNRKWFYLSCTCRNNVVYLNSHIHVHRNFTNLKAWASVFPELRSIQFVVDRCPEKQEHVTCNFEICFPYCKKTKTNR